MHTISIKSMYLFLLANQLHIIFTIGTMNDVIIWGNHLFEHLFYKRSSDFISTAIKSLCNVCTIKCWNVKLYIDYDACRYAPEANQFHTNMYIAMVRATFIILQVSSTAYSSWSTLPTFNQIHCYERKKNANDKTEHSCTFKILLYKNG